MFREMGKTAFLLGRRALKKPFFVLLLFLFPLGAWLFHTAQSRPDEGIAVALFTDGDAWNGRVAQRLAQSESAFGFYLCGSEEALMEDVAAGRAECGYVFSAGLHEALAENGGRRSVRLIVSPSSTAAAVSMETVFAAIYREYGGELLERYVEEGEAFAPARETEEPGTGAGAPARETEDPGTGAGAPARGTEDPGAEAGAAGGPDSIREETRRLYETYLSDGSTFSFEYRTVSGGILETGRAAAVFPVRGVGGVFIFVMGLAASVLAAEDEKRGLFAAVTAGRKRGMQALQIAAFVFLSCLSVGAGLAVSGSFAGFFREAAALAIYGAAVAAFASLLLFLLRRSGILAALIPFFITGSLVVCPVFADLSSFVPGLAGLRPFFLPWYYLLL